MQSQSDPVVKRDPVSTTIISPHKGRRETRPPFVLRRVTAQNAACGDCPARRICARSKHKDRTAAACGRTCRACTRVGCFLQNNIVYPLLKKIFMFFKKIFEKLLTDLQICVILLFLFSKRGLNNWIDVIKCQTAPSGATMRFRRIPYTYTHEF